MNKTILSTDHVRLNVPTGSKSQMIAETGKVLIENGHVKESYIQKMLEREELTSTYMGNYVAIPHGTEDAKSSILSSGISVLQVPEGVDFGNGNIAKVLIGIAGKNGEHLDILSQIAIVLSDEENVETIINATSKEEILSLFEETVQ